MTAARPFPAPCQASVDASRRVIARWRALVVERKRVLLLRLFELPDLFEQEVLKRLDLVDRTMLAQVWRPWLAAVLALGLPRLPTRETVRHRLIQSCYSVERLTWAKANGCPWTTETCVVRGSVRMGTWRCCSGRGSAAVRGTT